MLDLVGLAICMAGMVLVLAGLTRAMEPPVPFPEPREPESLKTSPEEEPMLRPVNCRSWVSFGEGARPRPGSSSVPAAEVIEAARELHGLMVWHRWVMWQVAMSNIGRTKLPGPGDPRWN